MTARPSVRTTFFVRHDPFPPVGGAAMRNWQNIIACSRFGPVQVLCTGSKAPGAARLDDHITLRYYGGDEAGILPDAVAARLGGLLRRACERASTTIVTRRIRQAAARDVQSFAPTVAIFEEYKCAAFASILRALPISIIYDAHNVEAVLQPSLMAERNVKRGERRYTARIMKDERSLITVADQVWVCSEADRSNVHEAFPRHRNARIIPNVIDVAKYATACERRFGRAAPEPLHLVFSGSYEYYPNQYAARSLIEEIFPRVAAVLPEAQLVLTGRAPTAAMVEAARKDPRIVVTGAVPDTAPYLERSQISLVPLQHGGGTRFKILEAFASGSAVISTRKGAEGLPVVDGKHLLFAETADEFAAAIMRLWHDTSLRYDIISKARRFVVAQHSPEALEELVARAVFDAARGLSGRREQGNIWPRQPGRPIGDVPSP